MNNLLTLKFPRALLRFEPATAQFPKPHRFSAQALPDADVTFSSSSSSDVTTLTHFTSCHNHIRVLEVSRRADHPFAGSRLLLLDSPGNIHSVSFLLTPFTSTYLDVFATLPSAIPVGPIALLGFGAGSAARLILHLHPGSQIHGWELDPAVIAVAREFFGLEELENDHRGNLFVHVGDAFDAEIAGGFSGIVVDLFSRGSLVPELQEEETWRKLKGRLRRGGRVMINCGGRGVEAEDGERRRGEDHGRVVMEETLRVMGRVFADEVFVLNIGGNREDSYVAFTGEKPDFEQWKGRLVKELSNYVDMWVPIQGQIANF